MKKSVKFTVIAGIILLVFLICFIFCSCNSCMPEKEIYETTTLVVDTVGVDTLDVDTVMIEELVDSLLENN